MPERPTQGDAASIRERLSAQIPRILDQIQDSATNHQKNLVALHKVQVEAAQYVEYVKKGRGFKLVGERIFEEFLFQMLIRVLPLKKGIPQADRAIKFVGGYIRYINEKALEEKDTEGNGVDVEDASDSTASRFTARLLNFLLKGFLSKDKSVRYRVLQTVAEMVAHLGEIDEDIYEDLRKGLLDRVNDKETSVRVQAVIALAKLTSLEDSSEIPEGELVALDALLDILAHDTSPEVRRATLLNILINSATLPHILTRTRDTDTTLRKLVYHNVLELNVSVLGSDLMGPTHPRKLTIAQRELIIRNGLGDREPSVRNAAASLLGKWVDIGVEDEAKKEEEEDQKPDIKAERGLVTLLNMLDLTTESAVAIDALVSVFVTRADIFESIEFGNDYWINLTPETAFLARVFVEHCKATKDHVRLEAALPVVTAMAFRIQEAYNNLIEDVRAAEEERLLRDSEEESNKLEEERIDKEFIIGEMLKLAVNLDYSDEIGRRKMFQLIRDMLFQEELPGSLLTKCLDVLRVLSVNERDLIRVVVEIVQDLRDPGDDEQEENNVDAETSYGDTPATVRPRASVNKPPEEQSPEKKARADAIDLRCLSLCIGMLERVNSKLEENSTLDGVLRELIIPSVRRKELAFREKGLVSLGLCCLIARPLALNSIGLFINQISDSPEVLKVSLLQVLFDMLMVHENDLLGKDGGDNSANIANFLTRLLVAETSQKVQALLCIGISKLVLSGMITDVKVVQNLITAYLSPYTAENQELRQCLTFFFPVYCYSSPVNQRNMQEIFIETYFGLNDFRKDLGEDEEMVSAAQVGALFVDWTDPQKLKRAIDAAEKVDEKRQADDFIHLRLASDIFSVLLKPENFKVELEKEDKRVLCQLLLKLYIPDTVDDDEIKKLKLLMNKLRSHRPLRDTVANNAFTKFETMISKKFEKQLEGFSEDEYRKLKQLLDLFEFLDDLIPEDDDEVISIDAPRKGRKRRSNSVVTTTTEGEDPMSGKPRRGRSKTKSKRPRWSTSDHSSDDEIEELNTPPASTVPRRELPKRSAASKKPIQIIEITSGSDEEPTPVSRRTRPKQRVAKVKEEEDGSDAEISEVLDVKDEQSAEIPFDSIMDDDSQDEDEVNNLLAED